jgi:Kdo2-lipid IVA lauroyltransferase/acyltransferase
MQRKRKKSKSALLERIEYMIYMFAARRIARSSPAALDRWADRLGRAAYRLVPRRSNLARRNLQRVFPTMPAQERERIVLGCWQHYARTILEFVRRRTVDPAELAARFDSSDLTEIERALARGHGLIVLTAHFGIWESGAAAASRFGRRVTVVARALDNTLLEGDLAETRERSGVEIVDRRGSGRELVRTLQQEGIVIILADQAPKPREGVLASFLGFPAWTTSSPAKLALRHRAPIVVVFCYPDPDRIVVEPMIAVDELPRSEQTVEGVTARFNEMISRRIAETPHLWLWFHDRWKGTEAAAKAAPL